MDAGDAGPRAPVDRQLEGVGRLGAAGLPVDDEGGAVGLAVDRIDPTPHDLPGEDQCERRLDGLRRAVGESAALEAFDQIGEVGEPMFAGQLELLTAPAEPTGEATTTPGANESVARYGHPYYTVYRPDLHGALVAAVRQGRPDAIRLDTEDGVPVRNSWNIEHLRKFYP